MRIAGKVWENEISYARECFYMITSSRFLLRGDNDSKQSYEIQASVSPVWVKKLHNCKFVPRLLPVVVRRSHLLLPAGFCDVSTRRPHRMYEIDNDL